MADAIWTLDGTVISRQTDIVETLLQSRGIDDPDDFLKITKRKLHNPYQMRNMKPAVVRIIKAIQAKKKIGIFGDYDADGVSSTSVWVLGLRDLGAEVIYFIPDRFKDGYGLNQRGIDFFKDEGVQLVITCDTGITAIEQIAYCKSIGMDIIVTDHHEPQEAAAYSETVQQKGKIVMDYLLPDTIVVNPKRPDCQYPFKGLAGVGVSFKILCAICDKIHPDKKKAAYKYMDIVALGTLADMMDIVDENRVICSIGIDQMNKTKNRGLYQLLRTNEIQQVTSTDIGWTIAPCINAAGRIVSAEEAVEMLISGNKLDAYRCAKSLVEINKQRKEITKNYVSNILKTVEAEQELNPTGIVVHYHPGIPEGIVGLVASHMMNHFNMPSVILTDAEEEGIYKGSGRSIESFNLFLALMKQVDLMKNFGGHPGACGLSLTAENFPDFKSRLEFFADAMLSAGDLQPKVQIDAVVKGDILDLDFIDEVSRLEPFGKANKKPVFMVESMTVIRAKAVGDEKNHFWALLSDGKRTYSTIGFFLWDKYVSLREPRKLDVACFPDRNEYPKGSGKVNVQLKIEDMRKVATKYGKGKRAKKNHTRRSS